MLILPIKVGKYRIKMYCHIWEKKYQMVKHLKASHGHTLYNGHAVTFIRKDKGKKEYIEIHFWKGRLGIDYVTHEIGHACVNISNILGLKIQTPFEQKDYTDEEIFLRIQGKAVRLFYEKLYEMGITEFPDFVKSKPLDKA